MMRIALLYLIFELIKIFDIFSSKNEKIADTEEAHRSFSLELNKLLYSSHTAYIGLLSFSLLFLIAQV
jgi:hypothetical protein